MESCGDCEQSQEAVRVKEEPEHLPSPVDCYLATPIKEETDNARPADYLDETQYVKDEGLRVDPEDQEATCSETAGCGDSSAAAMLAGLYADHTIKDERVLGPEVLHRPNVTPVFRGTQHSSLSSSSDVFKLKEKKIHIKSERNRPDYKDLNTSDEDDREEC